MTDGQKMAFHLGGNEEHLIVSADGEILQGKLLNKFCERLNTDEEIQSCLSNKNHFRDELENWQRFASYCRSCALSGESDPHDFETFLGYTNR